MNYPVPVDQVVDDKAVTTLAVEPEPQPQTPTVKPRIVPKCFRCDQPFTEFRDGKPVGYLVPRPDGKLGLECTACHEKHEAHKAE